MKQEIPSQIYQFSEMPTTPKRNFTQLPFPWFSFLRIVHIPESITFLEIMFHREIFMLDYLFSGNRTFLIRSITRNQIQNANIDSEKWFSEMLPIHENYSQRCESFGEITFRKSTFKDVELRGYYFAETEFGEIEFGVIS